MKDTLNVKLGQHRVRYSIISSDDQWQVLRWIAVYGDWEADPSYLPKYNDKRKAKRRMHHDLRALRAESSYY